MPMKKAVTSVRRDLAKKARKLGIIGFLGSAKTTPEEHLANLSLIEQHTERARAKGEKWGNSIRPKKEGSVNRTRRRSTMKATRKAR